MRIWLLFLLFAALLAFAADDDPGQPGKNNPPPGPDAEERESPENPPANVDAAPAPSNDPIYGEPPSLHWPHQQPSDATHPHLPMQRSWVDFSAIVPSMFPSLRHHVRRWTSMTMSWVSPNCPTSSIPEPPSRWSGPLACGCDVPSGTPPVNAPNVYGNMERDRLWTWCADFWDSLDDQRPEAAYFIPNIWGGRGPCRALNRRGVLYQFPAEATLVDENGRHWLRPALSTEMDEQNRVDNEFIRRIWPDADSRAAVNLPELDLRVFEGADSEQELRERWAAWVQTLLHRRGYILHDMLINLSYKWIAAWEPEQWQRLLRTEHFGPAPVGAWFWDTEKYAGQIRYFISLGVPVYYRWIDDFRDNLRLADLEPRPPPEDAAEGIPNPVMSPHRANKRAHELWTHATSKRPRPPKPFAANPARSRSPSLDLRPIFMDERAYNLLETQMDEIERAWNSQRDAASRNDSRPRMPLQERITDAPPAEPPRTPQQQRGRLLDRISGPPAVERARPQHRHEAGSGPAGPSRLPERTPANDRRRTRPTFALSDTPSAAHEPGAEDGWQFVFTDATPAMLSMHDIAATGGLPTHQSCIRFAVETGMAFATLLARPHEPFDLAASWRAHAVPDDWFITHDMTPQEQMRRWRESAMRMLARPHVRTALLRGGILWRIAQHLGLTVRDALRGPSDEVRTNGTPFPTWASNGGEYWDDYLSYDEIAILVGQVGRDGSATLLPRPETWQNYWWTEGAWMPEHEAWFLERLRELETAVEGLARSRDGWRSALKRNERYPRT